MKSNNFAVAPMFHVCKSLPDLFSFAPSGVQGLLCSSPSAAILGCLFRLSEDMWIVFCSVLRVNHVILFRKYLGGSCQERDCIKLDWTMSILYIFTCAPWWCNFLFCSSSQLLTRHVIWPLDI